MQLTIPDCCLGDFCSGIDASHTKREDGTYYSNDDHETNAYHYHNLDGSVFYRYPDRSEYYRHRNGNIRFKPPQPEGEDRAASKSSTPGQGWYDWPPRLDLTVKTDGSSYIIKDATGPPITFEPVVSGVGVNPTPARNGRSPSTRVQFERNLSQLNHGTTSGVQGRMNGHALADVLSDNEDY